MVNSIGAFFIDLNSDDPARMPEVKIKKKSEMAENIEISF